MRFPSLLAALALCTPLCAQGEVPPPQIGQTNPLPGLKPPAIPGTNVQQVHMIHLPGDAPNVFHTALTVAGLPAANGGVGGTDLLTGKYDVLTDTFTPNTEAAALNAAGTEFGLMFHHTGLHAVYDRLPGPPILAKRASLGSPWQVVGTITGLPSQSYYDPALATFKGRTYLLHVLGTGIAMTAIDLNTGALSTPSGVIVNAARSGSTANSPTPIVDSKGELIAISHHDVLGSDNDHYMSMDLDPATPALLFNDTPTWTNNGGFIGGRFYDAESTPSPYHIFAIDAFWTTGGRAPVGGAMELRAFVPPSATPGNQVSWLLIGAGFLQPPLPVPPFVGMFGLNNVLITLPLGMHNNLNGEALLTVQVPNIPGLSGAKVPVQSFTLHPTTGTGTVGNTALLTVD